MRRNLPLFLLLAACSGGGSHPHNPQPPAPPDAAPVASAAPDAAPATPPPAMTLADTGIVPEWIDAKADPCQDFFQYACGGFTATAQIPPDRSSWGAIQLVEQANENFLKSVLEQAAADPKGDPIQQKIGDYYAACMDEDGIEKAGTAPIQPMLDEIAKVKDSKTATETVIALHADGFAPFFNTGPTVDNGDATQVIAGMDQGGLGLDRDYYLKNEGNMKSVRTTYQGIVERAFGLLGAKPAAAKASAANVMKVETALAKLQQDDVTRRDPHAVYHKIDRKGLEKAAPSFPWGDYLKAIGIPDVTAITVNDPKYFTAWTKLLAKQKPAALRDYLTWVVVHSMSRDLGKAFVDVDFALQQVLQGAKELPPRWRRCVARVDQDLGEALGQAYVAAKFSPDAKASAIDMTRSVLGAMDKELDGLTWMDDATRAAAKAKLEKMAYLVGYPDHWRDYTFTVSRSDFAGNARAALKFELARQLAKIGKPVDRFEWEMTPPTVNAYYEPTLNELALPAGQLQPPFFGAQFHPAVNFGSTGGGTIGHEMTHGFDDEGSQFDGDGNLKVWWSKSTHDAFGKITQCVIDQYGQYEAVPGVKLNGKLTLGENIADIGGVKLGFQAYQQWRAAQSTPPPASVGGYSDDQLYFLAYGQSWCEKETKERLESGAHTNPHSPPMWRVNGVISDEPGFATAYQCAENTPMNPGAKQCAVW